VAFICAFAVLSLLNVLDAGAEKSAQTLDPAIYSPSRTVIVLSQNTQVYAADKPIGTVPPGAVLKFTKTHEKCLMIPRYGGWVFADDVVPLENSVQHFTSITEKQPSATAFLHRGIANMQLDKLEEARADFEKAIQLGTKDGAVYINLGNVLQRQGQTQEALLHYSKGIELVPDAAFPYIERSSVLMEMQQYPEAAADLEKALKLEPKSPEAFNNRGVLHRLQGQYDAAIQDYSKAIELFGKYPSAHANRGFAHRQLGRYAEALKDFNKALEFDPISAEIANDAAWLLATCPDEKIRDPQRALKLAEQAAAGTNREDGQSLDTLAAAYAANGQFPEAVKAGEAAIERLKGDPALVEIHARVELYRQQKPFTEAAK
jgi:tetratricopeptide (TPR) repeat protein